MKAVPCKLSSFVRFGGRGLDGGDRQFEAADKETAPLVGRLHIPDVQNRAFGNGMQGGK